MKHYITPDNKKWGFDETQSHLIPNNAVLIPESFTTEQFPYIILVNGGLIFNQSQYDADQEKIKNAVSTKNSALAKLTALGLTEDEVKALLG